LAKSISVSVWQGRATLRDALGNKDTGSSDQAIQFLAAGAQNRYGFFIESNRVKFTAIQGKISENQT
jgi:hypothetical protein